MDFTKNNEDINDIYDVSIVRVETENFKVVAFRSIRDSFLNNIIFSLRKLITAINLILIGHIFYENTIHYDLFMGFQIGVFVSEFLGGCFILGLFKNLFEEKEEDEEIYDLYIRMKSVLVILIPSITIPISILSYFIIGFILNNRMGVSDPSINRQVYFKFLLYTPIIYLFEGLILLDLHYFYCRKKTNEVFFYSFFYAVSHIILSWIFLYELESGLIGLTISYLLNSFIFSFFINIYFKKSLDNHPKNFFFFIPNSEKYDQKTLKLLGAKSILSLNNLGDIFMIHFIFILTLFTDRLQLIVNIIYINFYELINAFNRGFYANLKKYIITNVESSQSRQRFVGCFGLFYMIILLAIFLILIIFKDILLDIYLQEGGGNILIRISQNLRIIYPICLLLSGIRILLNGMVRGMNIAFSRIKKIIYISICMILSILLCFYFGFGIIGLWISILILNIFYSLESAHKAIIYLPIFFHNYI